MGRTTLEVDESAHPYPPARAGSDVDDYHGEAISDPYRWLENTDDPETVGWIKAQNERTEEFLSAVPAREAIRTRLTQLWNYPRYGVPFERGGRWFQSRHPGLAAQPVLQVMDAPDAEGRPLLDPNVLAKDGTVALSEVNVSCDGTLLAYATSDMGSDWQTWRVRDVATGADLDDIIEWSKFSEAAWRTDGSGFFYGTIESATPGAEYLEANRPMRIFFHRIGTQQRDDQLVFAAPEPDWFPYAAVSDDGRYLIILVERGTSENQVHILDLEDSGASFRQLVPDFATKAIVVTNVGTTFYLVTDHDAERQRLVAVDLDRPGRENWRQVIPEASETLLQAHFFGGNFVCHYLLEAHSVLRVHALDGALVRDITIPGLASLGDGAGGIEGRPGSDAVHFETISFTESGSLWAHQLSTGQTKLIRPSSARIDAGAFVTERMLAPSADGTQIPLFLTRRRDLVPDGDAPVLAAGSTATRGTRPAAWAASRTPLTTSAAALNGWRPPDGRARIASRSWAGPTEDSWSEHA